MFQIAIPSYILIKLHSPIILEYRFIISLISSDCLSIGRPSVPTSLHAVAALIDSVSLESDFKSSDNFFALFRSSCNSDEINPSLTEEVSDPSASFGTKSIFSIKIISKSITKILQN